MKHEQTKTPNHEEQLQLILGELQEMKTRLARLEEKVDARLLKSRPAWLNIRTLKRLLSI